MFCNWSLMFTNWLHLWLSPCLYLYFPWGQMVLLPVCSDQEYTTPESLWSPLRSYFQSFFCKTPKEDLGIVLGLAYSGKNISPTITELFPCHDTGLLYNFGHFCAFVPWFLHSLSGAVGARNCLMCWGRFKCSEVSRWKILLSFKTFVMKDTQLFYMCI